MKKRLFAIIFAITMSAVLNIHAQNSQTIGVTVPFEFTTTHGTLPAGSYRIEPVGDNRAIWKIRSADQGSGEFMLALILASNTQGDPRLTFHRYGTRNYLAGFKTPSYEVLLAAPKAEKVLREAGGPLAKMTVVDIKTAAESTR